MNIVMKPIGFIKSPFKEVKEIPKQSVFAVYKKKLL